MDPRRAKKPRSIGTESKSSRLSTAERPDVGERVHSVPSVVHRRQSSSKRVSEGVQISDVVDRSSQASIRDDPFFRSYDSPNSVRLAEQSRRANGTSSKTSPVQTTRDGTLPQVNIVLLGARGVGKSTFIQNSFDLRQLPSEVITSKKMSLDGVVYLVRLVEMRFHEVVLDETKIKWPKYLKELEVPSIDGVLALCDVTDQESFTDTKELLHTSTKTGIPCVLVSCKCDTQSPARQLDKCLPKQLGGYFGGVETCLTSAGRPETQKRCISILIRKILTQSGAEVRRRSEQQSARPRAATTSSRSRDSKSGASQDRSYKHDRAKSEISGPNTKGLTQSSVKLLLDVDDSETEFEEGEAPSSPRTPLTLDTNFRSQHASQTSQPHLSLLSSEGLATSGALSPAETDGPKTPETGEMFHNTSVLRPGTADTTGTADSQAHRTFLNMEEEDESEDLPTENSTPPSPDLDRLALAESPRREAGTSFSSLVDRLLAKPMSKHDEKFVTVYLCLYRKFATPKKLLMEILNRFEALERSKHTPLLMDPKLRSGLEVSKGGEQLRYLQILGQWTGEYPGDFATGQARKLLLDLVSKLETNISFAAGAREITIHLEGFAEDEDADWTFGGQSTATNDFPASEATAFDPTLGTTFTETLTGKLTNDSTQSSFDNLADAASRHSGAPSNGSETNKTGNTSNQSLTIVQTMKERRREARQLTPIPRTRLSKIQWHQFMETPDEIFADELTRIDWIMYSSIRPRDFVRHVTLTGAKKQKSLNQNSINRMVNHFNHLALFVTGMILLRDKPKHRAKALEKFMTVARKVRQRNNYNSLGSILAGINGTAIHRLALTRELVPPPAQKDFMKLTILMGTMRSHATYRLAWDNSSAERIPFLPLLLRDLAAAENGNQTFVGPDDDGINWKKFEIMGEVVLSIQKSQERPYKFTEKHDEIAKLVLETKVLEHEEDSMNPQGELYDRSVQLEPSGAGGEASRKKFDWLRRRGE